MSEEKALLYPRKCIDRLNGYPWLHGYLPTVNFWRKRVFVVHFSVGVAIWSRRCLGGK